MKFKTITDTYKTHNEDIYGVSKHGFWVIDGALPLSHAHHTDSYSDVVWMVNWWQNYLTKSLDQMDKSIVEIMEEGVDLVNSDYNQFFEVEKLSKLDCASASIAIVRIRENKLENFVLGDVEINLHHTDGKIITLVDKKMEDMDSEVINMIYNSERRIEDIVFNGYTADELKVLRENRMKMNSEGGYYVLEHDKTAIKHGIYEVFSIAEVKDVLIMSDGFSSIYNKYHWINQNQLFELCKSEGLETVLRKIRDLEDNDKDFNTYKRLRLHDDASAIHIEL